MNDTVGFMLFLRSSFLMLFQFCITSSFHNLFMVDFLLFTVWLSYM